MNESQGLTKPEEKNLAPWKSALIGARERFIGIAEKDRVVEWQRESMFALQAVEKNDYLRQISDSNPASLRNAIINVAACGITLNPAAQYAALVPRDGMVCLDIMYRGLIKIATDAGSIRWVQSELVYSTDRFTFKGRVAAPIHEANVFSKDRGEVIGVYCVAKTVDGDILTETMSVDEINEIRDRSSYYKKTKKGPWLTDYGEMAKKTVIKRARKTWPESSTGGAERLQVATEIANATDGYEALQMEPSAAITATAAMTDAWERLDDDQKDFLQGIANKVTAYIAAGQIDDACAWIDTQKLSTEETLSLWTRFDSKQRSAMKKHRASTKKAA